MSHRAAVYTVQLRPRRQRKADACLLGDIDGSGTNLAEVFNGFFGHGFEAENRDETRNARCETSEIAPDDARHTDEVRSIFQHGMTGVAADILGAEGQHQYRQVPLDTHLVRCGSLFRFKRDQRLGFWVVHVNNGRSPKSLVQQVLQQRMRENHEDFTLAFKPSVDAGALIQAVQRNKVEQITLSRLVQPNDTAVGETDKWVRAKDAARMKLKIRAGDRSRKDADGSFLKPGLLKKHFSGDDEATREILEFNGITFDEATIEVELETGRPRTFNIEAPEAGHAMTVDLEGLKFEDDEPTPESLFESLGKVLDAHGT